MVTGALPLNDVPERPVPIVRALVVLAVIVVLPPRDTELPFTVKELFARFALEIPAVHLG